MTARTMTLATQERAAESARQEPSFTNLLKFEYLKTSKRLMTRVIFGLMALAMAALHAGSYLLIFVLGVGEGGELEEFVAPVVIGDGFRLTSLLGPILIIILASGLAGSEYSWGTIRTLVGSGVDRGRLLAAKLVVLVAASVLLQLTGLGVMALISTGISLVEGQGLRLGWLDLSTSGDLLAMIARGSFVIAVFGIVGFALTQITRSVAVGIGAGIGMLIVMPGLTMLTGLLGDAGERIDDFLLTLDAEVLNAMNTFGTPDEVTGAPGPWHAAGALALYAALAIVVAIVFFRRRDIAVD